MEKTTSRGASCSVFLIKCHSGDQVKKNEIGRACSTDGERRGTHRVLVVKLEGRRPLTRPNRR